MAESCKSQVEDVTEAINHVLKALKKRHLLEEAAHALAILALSRPIVSQGFEWKEKAENLEVELQHYYKTQSRLSEQLVAELSESRVSKALFQQKENEIADMQKELTELRDDCSQLQTVVSENSELKAKLEQMTTKANEAESGNKMLINRFMIEKMKDDDRLHELKELYEDKVQQLKGSGLQQLAMKQLAENLEVELQRCYKAQSLLADHLVAELFESRVSKALVQEHENAIADMQKGLTELRDDCSQLQTDLEQKIKEVQLVVSENSELKAQLEQMTTKANEAEAGNKMLINRFMLEKLKDADRLNEAKALYEDMVQQASLEQLAREQVDGSEEGAEFFSGSNIPQRKGKDWEK